MNEPLKPDEAKRLILQILETGSVSISHHAETEMAKDSLTTVDCLNVLRSGVVEPAEYERDTWRYRVRARQVYVVVAFRSEQQLVIVTAWRSK